MTWLRELWCWLVIWGLKKPCSLAWDIKICNISLIYGITWCVKLYGGIVSIGCWLNLWRKKTILSGEELCWDKQCQPGLADVPNTEANALRDVWVQVSSDTMSDMISCNGWPESSQEHNACIPHLDEHDNCLGCVGSYNWVYTKHAYHDWDNALMSVVVIVLKYGCTNPRRGL